MMANSTTAPDGTGIYSNSTSTTASTRRRGASHIEGRPRKQQYAQEFHPYHSSSTGQGSRHKKHRSQPVNFLEDHHYLTNSNGLLYTAPVSSTPSGNYANFLQENRVPVGSITQNSSMRQRSLSETTLQHGFLQDVTGGVTNVQDLSKPQLNGPATPRGLNGTNFMPITPGSPFVGLLPQNTSAFSLQITQQASMNPQFLLSPQSTRKIKRAFPTPIRSIKPPSNLVEELRGHGHMRRHSVDTTPIRTVDSYFAAMNSGLPSPPNSAPLIATNSFDMAPMPHTHSSTISHITVPEGKDFDDDEEEEEDDDEDEDDDDDSYFSPSGSSAGSPTSSFSPHMQSIDGVLASGKLQEALQRAGDSGGFAQSSRDNQIAELDDEARVPGGFVRASGISNDEISAYISGPESLDNKWVCLYPECNKRFGRKENIKSHVQTHLGDRQFRCEVCKKCFVRQHDLKRHAKIHTGVKPYPCKCGNSFARHDALTRHRQRGMCIGAFEGIVKKIVKRGRPKKIKVEGEPETSKKKRKGKKRVGAAHGCSSSGSGSSVSSGSSVGASSPSAYDESETWENPNSPVFRLLETVPEISSNLPPAIGKRKRGASSDSEEEAQGSSTKRGKLDKISMDSLTQFDPSDFGLPPTSPIYSAPSSPGDLLTELPSAVTKRENSLNFVDPLLSSFNDNTSFTPEGSPEFEILHRRYVSAFNTPEWDGLTAPAIAAEEVDLREILGLSDLETSAGAGSSGVGADFPSWGNSKDMNSDLALSGLSTLNSGFDLGLSDEGFDFIKPELLQENDVLDLQLWQNLQDDFE